MEVKKSRDLKKLYQPPPQQDYSSNYTRLIIVMLISFVFIGGQIAGGIIATSIAIIADAVHLVSDLIGFFFSFLFLYLSKKPQNQKMTFGYHRMELLGALANIFIIWFLVIFVMYEATLRIIHKNFVQKPFVMLIVAVAGLFVNIAMYKVLHGGATHSHGLLSDSCAGHDHEHGHQHSNEHHEHHGHSHHKEVQLSHKHSLGKESHQRQSQEDTHRKISMADSVLIEGSGKPKQRKTQKTLNQNNKKTPLIQRKFSQDHQHVCRDHDHKHEHKHHHKASRKNSRLPEHESEEESANKNEDQLQHSSHKEAEHSHKEEQHHHHDHHSHDEHGHKHEHDHGHNHEHDYDQHHSARNQSVGMQAAILHALSDMIMSVGLVLASLLIFFFGNPNGHFNNVTEWNPWQLLDPLATYLFSVLSLAATIPVIKNAYYLMMESTPSYIDLKQLKKQFEEIQGIIDVHDIHVWDLKPGKTVVIAHVLAKKNMERQVLIQLSHISREKRIYHSTFQVEEEERKSQQDYIRCHHDIH